MWLQTGTTLLHIVVSITTYNVSVICSLQDSGSHWWYISNCLLQLCTDLYFGGLDPFQYPWVMTLLWSTYIKASEVHANCSPFVAPAAHYISLLSWAEVFTIPCFSALLWWWGWNLRMFWEKEELPEWGSSQRKMERKKGPRKMFVLMQCAPNKCSTQAQVQ